MKNTLISSANTAAASIIDEINTHLDSPADSNFHLEADRMSLFHEPVHTVAARHRATLDRYVFIGPETANNPIKLGIFGGLAASNDITGRAISLFLDDLQKNPDLARGLHLYAYPQSLGSSSASEIFTDLWQESEEAEPYLIERELGVVAFDGVITLLRRHQLGGFLAYLYGAGGTLQDPLVQTIYDRLQDNVSLAEGHDRSAPQRLSVTTGGYLKPRPFELTFQVPFHFEESVAVNVLRLALHSAVAEYLSHVSHANHI